MTTFTDRLADVVALDDAQRVHLHRLVAWWGLLADFSFADLLMFAPSRTADGEFVMLGHVRPTTSQTLYYEDVVGRTVTELERPLVSRAARQAEIIEGEITLPDTGQRARVTCIPVRFESSVIAVLTREVRPDRARRRGELETRYLGVFDRVSKMVADGVFPFADDDTDVEEVPRVGDGVTILDSGARVVYASPNATSTLHRLGVVGNVLGLRLVELGIEQTVVRRAFRERVTVHEEVERGSDSIVEVLCVPLIRRNLVTGAVVILRDVSELRRRDRLLISKDATIREIHHRVKNNLQTIMSLLRLQARRIDNADAKAVIQESVQRIAAIAVVHETLAHESGQDVPLVGVVGDLVRLFADSVRAPERPVEIRVEGDPGIVPAAAVTPLAVVLNELLQNVVDHGPTGAIEVLVGLDRIDDQLVVEVTDNGPGIDPDFDIETAPGLGLSIVRALVTSDLGGTIELVPRADGRSGSTARIRVPIAVAARRVD